LVAGKEDKIRLGLNVPLFVAGIVSIGVGTLVGMVAIWWYLAWKELAPFWQKVSHAHAAWWSALIIIAAMLLPSLNLKPWVKKAIIAGTFVGPVFWVGVLAAYYELGGPAIWRFEVRELVGAYYEIPLLGVVAGILEFLGFLSLGLVGLSASGVNIPFLSTSSPPPRSRFDLISDVEVPRGVFRVPTLVIIFGVLVGFFITSVYKMAKLPITPAALVQLHDHTALIATSAMIILLVLSVLGVGERVFRAAYTLMLVSLPLVTVGLVAFVAAGLHSIVWVAPAGIYYLMIPLALLAAAGLVRTRASGGPSFMPSLKAALAVCLAGITILVAQGAVIALVWSNNPYVTVTYKQPEGSPYPGPYPSKFIGTAPVVGTPRGLENAHLSPGSWFHIALTWLVLLAVVGEKIFKGLLGRPNLVYLFITTIPAAPLFNMLGRYLAWAGIPNGIGALLFAGHPIKGFNIISLFVIGVIALYLLSRKRGPEPV
jgi:hypothetical protein